MGKVLTAIAAMLACVSATEADTPQDGFNTTTSFAYPPPRYRGDNAALVIFASDVTRFCGPSAPGLTKLGCAGKRDGVPIIVLPNPNRTFLTPGEYQKLVAHELAHTLGWSGDHPL